MRPQDHILPVARIRTTRGLRGTVHRVVALTPYDTQTIVDELKQTRPGTAVEILLPADVSDPLGAHAAREFSRLQSQGVEIAIRYGDAPHADTPTATSPSGVRAAAELAVLMGRLLHELQSERAVTAAHLTACLEASSVHLEAQWRATNGVLEIWDAALVAYADMLPPLVGMHASAVNALVVQQLEPMRRGSQVRVREAAEAVDFYTQLAHALLAAVDGLVSPETTATMTAHLAFLHAKEEAAVAQLEGTSALRHRLAHSLAAHVASRTAYLHTFATTASQPVLSEYRALVGEPECCDALDCDTGPDADGDAWYRTMASLAERFRDVESRSAETLLGSAT